MRRNKRGSRRVSTKTEHSSDQNKGLPVMQAVIYNAKDLGDLSIEVPHVEVPSPRSWSSLRGNLLDDDDDNDDDVSPRTTTRRGRNDVRYNDDVSPRTITRPDRKGVRSEVSPMNNNPTTWCNSPMSPIEPIDFAATAEERKASDGTIFPSFSPEIKKSTYTSKDAHGEPELARFYKTTRAIYDVGPKGEGQKLWSTYKRVQKGQKQHTEVEQKVPDPLTAPRRPSAPGLSAQPPTRPAPPDTDIPIRQAVPPGETLYLRNNSEVSRTSCEVPIRIGPEIKQIVDRSRPLPPVPQLQASPKARQQGHGKVNTSKPLPSNPRSNTVCKAGPSTKSEANHPLPPIPLAPSKRQNRPLRPKRSLDSPPLKGYSTSSSASNYHSIQQRNDKQPTTTKPRNLATHWWKALADLTSEEPPIKSKIGRPRPITALESGRTPNLAPECGGVGGEGAVQPKMSERTKGKQKATTITNPHSEVAKDKQKATATATNTNSASMPSSDTGLLTPRIGLHFPKTWLDKLSPPGSSRKRGDSDASFGCVGVEEGHGAYRGVGVGEEWGLRPSPLFSGRRSGNAGDGSGKRDTRFYGPYEEVLDEYRA